MSLKNQLDAVLGCGAEDVLVLVHFDLDAPETPFLERLPEGSDPAMERLRTIGIRVAQSAAAAIGTFFVGVPQTTPGWSAPGSRRAPRPAGRLRWFRYPGS